MSRSRPMLSPILIFSCLGRIEPAQLIPEAFPVPKLKPFVGEQSALLKSLDLPPWIPRPTKDGAVEWSRPLWTAAGRPVYTHGFVSPLICSW